MGALTDWTVGTRLTTSNSPLSEALLKATPIKAQASKGTGVMSFGVATGGGAVRKPGNFSERLFALGGAHAAEPQ